jgi:hypothetical protein
MSLSTANCKPIGKLGNACHVGLLCSWLGRFIPRILCWTLTDKGYLEKNQYRNATATPKRSPKTMGMPKKKIKISDIMASQKKDYDLL